MAERSYADICEELDALRKSVFTYSGEKRKLEDENEKLKRDLENTQVLLSVCIDKLKQHGIGLGKR